MSWAHAAVTPRMSEGLTPVACVPRILPALSGTAEGRCLRMSSGSSLDREAPAARVFVATAAGNVAGKASAQSGQQGCSSPLRETPSICQQ